MFDFIPEEAVWAILIIVIIYLLKVILSPAKDFVPTKVVQKPVYEKRDYSLEEIKDFKGIDETKPIFIAIKGKIYDVTAKKTTYGPGGSYHLFAGNDATVCLAKSSFEEVDLNQPWTNQSLEELTADQKDSLKNWIDFFSERYTLVGNVKTE